MQKKRCLSVGLILFLLMITADQLTKHLAEKYLAGGFGCTLIPGVFELYYLENKGAAFGMLANCQIFFIAIALAMLIVAFYIYIKLPASRHYHLLRFVCILVASGAVGNMIDRLARHYVIDFLYFSLIDFPIFNLADCYVCIGAGLAVILLFTVYRTEEFSFLKFKSK